MSEYGQATPDEIRAMLHTKNLLYASRTYPMQVAAIIRASNRGEDKSCLLLWLLECLLY